MPTKLVSKKDQDRRKIEFDSLKLDNIFLAIIFILVKLVVYQTTRLLDLESSKYVLALLIIIHEDARAAAQPLQN